jgi:hypothetical protein
MVFERPEIVFAPSDIMRDARVVAGAGDEALEEEAFGGGEENADWYTRISLDMRRSFRYGTCVRSIDGWFPTATPAFIPPRGDDAALLLKYDLAAMLSNVG